MDRLIERQMDNIEKAYESIPFGGKLEFSKSAIEGIHQVLRELKEYKDLEESGLLIKIPYPFSIKTLYALDQSYDEIYELDASNITIIPMPYNNGIIYEVDCWEFKEEDMDKTVFLTREEAEEKLIEIKGERYEHTTRFIR